VLHLRDPRTFFTPKIVSKSFVSAWNNSLSVKKIQANCMFCYWFLLWNKDLFDTLIQDMNYQLWFKKAQNKVVYKKEILSDHFVIEK
jgi:hypothetical protein